MNKSALALLSLFFATAALAPAQQLVNAPLFQGQAQGDLNLGGHNLANAGAVSATTLAGSLPWSNITGAPTTLAGYGVTDSVLVPTGSYANPAWLTSLAASKLTGSLAWSILTGTPTTLAGYGITDAVVKTTSTYADPAWITSLSAAKLTGSLAWSSLTGTPTTLVGYGITDSVVKTTSTYADPAWITSLSAAKLTGTVANAALASAPALTVKGNASATTQPETDLTMTSLRTMLALAFTNISGAVTKAQSYATTAFTDAMNTFVGVQTLASSAADTTHAGVLISTSTDGYPAVRFQNAGTTYWEFGIRAGTTDMFAIYDDVVNGSSLTITSYADTVGGLFGFNLGGITKATEVIEAKGNVKANHLIGRSAAPSCVMGTGAGTSSTSTSVTGTDASGTIAFTTGTSPAANAVIATLTFAAGYGAAPHHNVPAGNNLASCAVGTNVYYTTTSTTLVLHAGGTALAASTAYTFDYLLVQ